MITNIDDLLIDLLVKNENAEEQEAEPMYLYLEDIQPSDAPGPPSDWPSPPPNRRVIIVDI